MAKLTYDEIMRMMRAELTPELIDEVIEEMGLNSSLTYDDPYDYYPRSDFEMMKDLVQDAVSWYMWDSSHKQEEVEKHLKFVYDTMEVLLEINKAKE